MRVVVPPIISALGNSYQLPSQGQARVYWLDLAHDFPNRFPRRLTNDFLMTFDTKKFFSFSPRFVAQVPIVAADSMHFSRFVSAVHSRTMGFWSRPDRRVRRPSR